MTASKSQICLSANQYRKGKAEREKERNRGRKRETEGERKKKLAKQCEAMLQFLVAISMTMECRKLMIVKSFLI